MKRFLRVVDGWRLAAAIACVAVAVLAIFSVKLWVDLNDLVEQNSQEAVEACFREATSNPILIRMLRELEALAPTEQARQDIRNFSRVSYANAPTLRECRGLAASLGVNGRQR